MESGGFLRAEAWLLQSSEAAVTGMLRQLEDSEGSKVHQAVLTYGGAAVLF